MCHLPGRKLDQAAPGAERQSPGRARWQLAHDPIFFDPVARISYQHLRVADGGELEWELNEPDLQKINDLDTKIKRTTIEFVKFSGAVIAALPPFPHIPAEPVRKRAADGIRR